MNIDTELDMARNMFGHLAPDLCKRVFAACDNPSQETWEDAYSIIVGADGWMTLWQAVVAVRPGFCRSRLDSEPWPMIPTRQDLYMALKYATH